MNDFYIGVESFEDWFVIHSDGHEHKPRKQKNLMELVTAHNEAIRKQIANIVRSPENEASIKELESQLKKLRRCTRRVPKILTLKYKSTFLNISRDQYQSILEGTHVIVYWYGRLFLLDDTKYLHTYLIGDPEDVFMVDADCLDPEEIKEKVTEFTYEC